MSDSAMLAEKRAHLRAKQDELKSIMDLAKDGAVYDLSRKNVMERLGAVDANDALSKVKERNVQLDDLGRQLQQAELQEINSAAGERERQMNTPHSAAMQHPVEAKARTFGDMVVNAKAYKDAGNLGRRGTTVNVLVEDISIKTLMETSAGFAPESVRTGLLVEAATRPIQILDLIPTRPVNQAADKYMEETTRTHNAAEKAEGAAFAESVFVWTERTQLVEKITDSIPVTDEQLLHAPVVAGIINTRLVIGIRQRLDLQVLVGDGTSPNLKGILDHSIGSQAKGADPTFDATYKALTTVRVTGRAFPNAFIFHPNDWQDVRLTRTADGQYIMGHPSQPGATTLWGLPVAVSDAITENTALTGDFANFCYIGENRGIEVAVGYVGDQFKEGKRTIRADMFCCMTVTRAAAFCKITGL
jgi:HK97 family phage major capsid protein